MILLIEKNRLRDGEIISCETIEHCMDEADNETYRIMMDGKKVGGVILKIDQDFFLTICLDTVKTDKIEKSHGISPFFIRTTAIRNHHSNHLVILTPTIESNYRQASKCISSIHRKYLSPIIGKTFHQPSKISCRNHYRGI